MTSTTAPKNQTKVSTTALRDQAKKKFNHDNNNLVEFRRSIVKEHTDKQAKHLLDHTGIYHSLKFAVLMTLTHTHTGRSAQEQFKKWYNGDGVSKEMRVGLGLYFLLVTGCVLVEFSKSFLPENPHEPMKARHISTLVNIYRQINTTKEDGKINTTKEDEEKIAKNKIAEHWDTGIGIMVSRWVAESYVLPGHHQTLNSTKNFAIELLAKGIVDSADKLYFLKTYLGVGDSEWIATSREFLHMIPGVKKVTQSETKQAEALYYASEATRNAPPALISLGKFGIRIGSTVFGTVKQISDYILQTSFS